MFKELEKYNDNGSFVFTLNDKLNDVCKCVPTDKSGIYFVYDLDKNELIYIGISGKKNSDGTMNIRKAGVGGIKDRLVNGKQFGSARHNSWKTKMNEDKIQKLKIHWYVTHNKNFVDCPRVLENELLKQFLNINGKLPLWNNEL